MINLEEIRKQLADHLRVWGGNPLKELLRDAYIDKQMSIHEISKATRGEASPSVVYKLLKSCGIKLRPRGGRNNVKRSTANARGMYLGLQRGE